MLLLGPVVTAPVASATPWDPWMYQALVAGSGVVTVGPLLLFGASVRLIPLSHMGIIQYLAPTLQFVLGVVVYGEQFGPSQVLGYGLVWVALVLFGVEGLYAYRRPAEPAPRPERPHADP